MRPLDRPTGAYRALGLAALAACLVGTALSATEPPAQAVTAAVQRGDCAAAVATVNRSLNSSDPRIVHLAGRMLDEGVCVKRNAEAATDYYQRAVEMGEHSAALDYGASIGLGKGVEQSYARAGEMCRVGGIDASGQVSAYSLGYACTLRAVAGQALRQRLPLGAIPSGSGPVVVGFVPAAGTLVIRSVPPVATSDSHTGTFVRKPVIDLRGEIERAWREATAAVPTPEATRLESRPVEMSLDVDTALESGRPENSSGGTVLRGEITPVFKFGPAK